jgi:hypothetical protein
MIAVIIALTLQSSGVRAQGSAYISGYVFDPSHAVIPDVSVVIMDEATGVSTVIKSNDAGLYRSPTLTPGTYTISAERSGFKKLVRPGVVVTLGQPLGLDLNMELGEVGTEVRVTAEAPLLRTEDSGLGQSVEYKSVESLPLFNRNAGVMVSLTPGVRYLGEDFISYGASRFNGGGMGNVNVMVNGANVDSDRTDVNQMTYNPSVESLSEVRVVQNNYSAEFGQDVGMLVQMQTKSGSNALHGGVYEYFRNEAMDTYNGFSNTKPLDRQHIFGGSVGGPIKKNKLFFFNNFEGQKQRNPAGTLLTVPTVAMKNGDFSGLRDPQGNPIQIYDPASSRVDPATGNLIRDAFPGNIIPRDRWDPVAVNVFGLLPDPNLPGSITGGNNLTGTISTTNDKWRNVLKMDWNISDSDKLDSSWFIDRTTVDVPGFNEYPLKAASPVGVLGGFGFNFQTQVFHFQETHTFSPNVFMMGAFEFRPRRIARSGPHIDPAAKYAETLGIKNYAGERLPPEFGGDLGFPSFSFTGYSPVGPGFLAFQEDPINEFNYSHNVTYIKGKHTFKVGAGMQKSTHGAPDQGLPTGSFDFSQLSTSLPGVTNSGNAMASFLLGQVNSASTSLGPLQIWRQWYYDAFIQDDWKVSPKLTFNLGFRWDIDAPVYEDNDNGNGFNPYQINPVSGTPGVVTFLGQNGNPRSFYDTNYHRFAPRFGFAYRLTEKTVVRGGYGIFNTSPILGANRRAPNLGFTTAANFNSPDGGLTPTFILGNGFPDYPLGGDRTKLNDSFGAVPVGQTPTTGVTYLDRRWKFGYAQNFNLSIQRELPWNMIVEVAAQGVLGRNLSIFVERNEVPPEFWGVPGNNQVRRPYPQFSSVTQTKSQDGSTNYYAGTFRLEKRFSNGLNLIGNYAWSKSIGFTGGSIYFRDLSRGPTLYDESNNPTGQAYHQGLISWVYEFPAGPGKARLSSGALSKFLGGWSVSGIATLKSGVPFDIGSGIDSLNGNSPLGSRVNLIGDPNAGEQTPDHWFNTAAFAAPAFGTIGTYCCGLLTSPGNRQLNLAVAKVTKISERFGVKFSAEFFNFTNTPQWGVPETNLSSPNFGRITGALAEGANNNRPEVGARIVQMGLRIDF